MIKQIVIFLILALLATPTLATSVSYECVAKNRCIQDQSLRIQIEQIRVRGNYVSISATLTNLSSEDLELSVLNEYLSATTFEGERVRFTTIDKNVTLVSAYSSRSLAYSLKFDNPVGEGIDLVLTFENPNSSYGFFDLIPIK